MPKLPPCAWLLQLANQRRQSAGAVAPFRWGEHPNTGASRWPTAPTSRQSLPRQGGGRRPPWKRAAGRGASSGNAGQQSPGLACRSGTVDILENHDACASTLCRRKMSGKASLFSGVFWVITDSGKEPGIAEFYRIRSRNLMVFL